MRYMCEVLHVCDTCVRYCMCAIHVCGTTCEVIVFTSVAEFIAR